jgi:hypothetical protein
MAAREETRDLMWKLEELGTLPFWDLLEMAEEALDPSVANDEPAPVNVVPPTNWQSTSSASFIVV